MMQSIETTLAPIPKAPLTKSNVEIIHSQIIQTGLYCPTFGVL
jgi:hypothetical protein